MTTHAIGPHPRPSRLVPGPSRHQEKPPPVEDVTGKSQMQRRPLVVNVPLGRRTDGITLLIEEYHQLAHVRHLEVMPVLPTHPPVRRRLRACPSAECISAVVGLVGTRTGHRPYFLSER